MKKLPVGGWVMVFSMRDGRNPSSIHTPQEILAVARTWHLMRKNRHEPTLQSINGYISSAAGSGDTFILHGVSDYDFNTTKQTLDELAACMGLAFNLDAIEVIAGEQHYALTRQPLPSQAQYDR